MKRLNEGLSPEDLGKKLGVSGGTIRNLERGRYKPTPRIAYVVAQYLGKDVADLYPELVEEKEAA